jgi:hypothetical protein
MKTAAERLQFVIRFAQMDLESLRAGDWLNLREDCMAFLGIEVQGGMIGIQLPRDSGGIIGLPLNSPFPTELSVEDFKGLQSDTRRILDEWVGPDKGEQGTYEGIVIQARHTVTRTRRDVGSPWISWLQVVGATRDIFCLVLFHLLRQESMDAVRRCSECRTIFYRVGKQQYCSRTCSNRANVRTWRQREEVKQAEAERAHTRYVKKKQPELGTGTKVKRRPRKRSTGHAETPRQS